MDAQRIHLVQLDFAHFENESNVPTRSESVRVCVCVITTCYTCSEAGSDGEWKVQICRDLTTHTQSYSHTRLKTHLKDPKGS